MQKISFGTCLFFQILPPLPHCLSTFTAHCHLSPVVCPSLLWLFPLGKRGYLKHATQARHETPRQAPSGPSAKSKSACQAPCTAKVCRKGIREAGLFLGDFVVVLTFQLGKMPTRIFLGHFGGWKSLMKMARKSKGGNSFFEAYSQNF